MSKALTIGFGILAYIAFIAACAAWTAILPTIGLLYVVGYLR